MARPGPGPSKTGLNPNPVEGEIRPCHRIDELFKPNWPPETPETPRRPPRPPQEGFENILYFFFSKKSASNEGPSHATYSPSPAAASRQRGTARNHLKPSVLRAIKKKGYWSKTGSIDIHLCLDFPLDAILGWDPEGVRCKIVIDIYFSGIP